MIKLGHMGLNAVLGFPVAVLLTKTHDLTSGLIFIFGLIVFASLPDGDELLSNTTSNGKLSFLPFEITHRGITHTIYFAVFFGLLLGLITSVFVQDDIWIVIGASAGLSVAFHTCGDVFTPTGVNFIPPLTSNYTLDWFGYNNLVANCTMYSVGLVSVLSVVVIGWFDVGSLGIGFLGSLILLLTLASLRKARESDKRLGS